MSRDLRLIRSALETSLKALTPDFPTAWENVPFTPISGVAYQKVNLLVAEPLNSEFGENFIEQGIFQVTLMYPLEGGTAGLTTRAILIRNLFKRGSTHQSGAESVLVMKTPTISEGRVDGDRWAVPVKIIWQA